MRLLLKIVKNFIVNQRLIKALFKKAVRILGSDVSPSYLCSPLRKAIHKNGRWKWGTVRGIARLLIFNRCSPGKSPEDSSKL
jgi:hypothetical protein